MRIFLLNMIEAEKKDAGHRPAYDQGFHTGQVELARILLKLFFGEGATNGHDQHN